MSRAIYQCGLERCPGTRGVPHVQAECPSLPAAAAWRATDTPNDGCCWSAHVEVAEPEDILRNRPRAIADVTDRETADRIVLEHNAHEALVSVCEQVLAHLPDAALPGSWDHESAKLIREALALAGRIR